MGRPRGIPFSEEHRKKLSEAAKGREKSPETRRKISESKLGEKHHNWKGGRQTTLDGYTLILVGKGHPLADSKGYAREHRLVMAEHLGRPLDPTEDVHHINGDKSDNRIENLKLMTHADHQTNHGTHDQETIAAIYRLRDGGMYQDQIARELGISQSSVSRYLKRRS